MTVRSRRITIILTAAAAGALALWVLPRAMGIPPSWSGPLAGVGAVLCGLLGARWMSLRSRPLPPLQAPGTNPAESLLLETLEAVTLAASAADVRAEKRVRRLTGLCDEIGRLAGLLPADIAALHIALLVRELGPEVVARVRFPEPVHGALLTGDHLPASASIVLTMVDRIDVLMCGSDGRPPLPLERALDRMQRDNAGDPDPSLVTRCLANADRIAAVVDAQALRPTLLAAPAGAGSEEAAPPLVPVARRPFGSFEQEMLRAVRSGSPLSLIELDIDAFSAINSRWGRPAGERVLRGVARAIRSQLRPGDTCVRCATDTFIVTVPGVGSDGLEAVLSRLDQAVRRHKFAVARGVAITVSVSLGAASFPTDGASHEDLIATARARRQAVNLSKRGSAADPGVLVNLPGHSDVPVN